MGVCVSLPISPICSPGVCHDSGQGTAPRPRVPHGRAGLAASLLPFSMAKTQAAQKGFSSDTCTEVTDLGLIFRKAGHLGTF